jgi:hydroxyacylglutathione hydrolase
MHHEITAIPALRDNYVWLIERPGSRAAAVVDPGEAEPVLEALSRRGLELAAIIVTHHHHDHVGGIAALRARSPVRVFGPAIETIPGRTDAVEEGDAVDIAEIGLSLRAMWVPGHTLGAIAYYGDGVVFTGDTLFAAGCGRLFEGTPAQMHASLGRLAALPGETRVYCGHEYTLANLRFAATVEPGNAAIAQRLERSRELCARGVPTLPSTIALERQTNPFLRTNDAQVQRAAEMHCGHALSNATEVFSILREWKNRY